MTRGEVFDKVFDCVYGSFAEAVFEDVYKEIADMLGFEPYDDFDSDEIDWSEEVAPASGEDYDFKIVFDGNINITIDKPEEKEDDEGGTIEISLKNIVDAFLEAAYGVYGEQGNDVIEKLLGGSKVKVSKKLIKKREI